MYACYTFIKPINTGQSSSPAVWQRPWQLVLMFMSLFKKNESPPLPFSLQVLSLIPKWHVNQYISIGSRVLYISGYFHLTLVLCHFLTTWEPSVTFDQKWLYPQLLRSAVLLLAKQPIFCFLKCLIICQTLLEATFLTQTPPTLSTF